MWLAALSAQPGAMCADESWSHLEGQQTCADGHRWFGASTPCGPQLTTKSKRVTKLAVTKMGRAAASLGLFPLATLSRTTADLADASISCAASLLCFTDVRRDKLLASLTYPPPSRLGAHDRRRTRSFISGAIAAARRYRHHRQSASSQTRWSS